MSTYKPLHLTSLVFVEDIDQDKSAQNVQSDLGSTLSTTLTNILAKKTLKWHYFRCFALLTRTFSLIFVLGEMKNAGR